MSGFSGRLGRLGLGGLGERVKSLRRGSRSAAADADGWAAGAADGWAALPSSTAAPHPSTGIVVGSATATTEEEAEAVLRELAPGYFDPPSEFDALEHELRQLPVDFTQDQLEAVAEDRTGVLEVRRWAGGVCRGSMPRALRRRVRLQECSCRRRCPAASLLAACRLQPCLCFPVGLTPVSLPFCRW